MDLGLVGVVLGAIGVGGFAVLFVLRELRLASRRRAARERMRRRAGTRWPA